MKHCRQLQISTFGPASHLTLTMHGEIAEPGSAEVMVNMAFAGVNPIDAKTRAGLGWAAQEHRDSLPWTPGYDASGEVLAVGSGVKHLQVGDRVAGLIGFPLRGGCYSELIVAPEAQWHKLPAAVTLEAAAALPLAGLTAWQALFEHGQLHSGDTVLITAGAGGVGHIAVQLAHQAGARVITTASSHNHAWLLQLGADQVLDYHHQEISKLVRGVDLVLDLVGGDTGAQALSCLKPEGRMITVPTVTAEALSRQAAERGLTASGMLLKEDRQQLAALFERLADGTLKVAVAERFALADGSQAHLAIERGHTRGKILLRGN